MKAYHFLRDDMTAGSGAEPAWAIGESRTVEGEIALCEKGYHFSLTPWNALNYAPGPMLCLVEVDDDAFMLHDKGVSHSRTLVRAVNVERQLHELACAIAEDALPLFEAQYPDDKRPREAIETKRRWLRGEATDKELAAASATARATARATAASATAREAATAAAEASAASATAWATATAAAFAAAGTTAREAAKTKYARWANSVLLECITSEAPGR